MGLGAGAWHVQELELENFRCFERLSITFEEQLTLLIGENGIGKSAALDGLVVMLSTILKEFEGETRGFGADDARVVPHDLDSRDTVARMEPQYPVVGRARAVLDGRSVAWTRERIRRTNGRTTWAVNDASEIAAKLARKAARNDRADDAILPLIASYGVERLVKDRRAVGSIGATRFAAYAAALDPRSDLPRLSLFLRDLTESVIAAESLGDAPAAAAQAQIETIRLACDTVLEGSGWGRPRWNAAAKGITLSHREHGVLPLALLSAGIKIAAGLVIDLASRAARANPHLGAAELLERVPGIVLVDEVDLHLHPSWQQRIVPSLLRAFPQVQFILTSHSPQVISTVQAEQVRDLAESTVARKFQFSRGLRSDVVLRTLMRTDPEPAETPERRNVREYMRLVFAGDGKTEVARALRAELEEHAGDSARLPELAEADAHMAFEDLIVEP